MVGTSGRLEARLAARHREGAQLSGADLGHRCDHGVEHESELAPSRSASAGALPL